MNIHSPSTKKHKISGIVLLLTACCLLTACEQNKPGTPPLPQIVKKYDTATTLEGAVSNNSGLIKAGTIKVTDNQGQLITSTVVQNTGHYRVEIPANTALPLVMTFYPESDKKDAEQFVTVVIHPTITQYDLTPLTTMIANKAKALGGYTHANMVQAAADSVHVPDANKTTSGFRGDPTTQYGGWH